MMSSYDLGTVSRALTVVQPWAHAIVHLGKDIENRSWKPPEALIGKRFAIHAGCSLRTADLEDLQDEGYTFPTAPVLRAIIATVRLAGWVCDKGQRSQNLTVEQARVALRSRWYVPGEIGWMLADVDALPSPVTCKGALGLWSLSRLRTDEHPVREKEVAFAKAKLEDVADVQVTPKQLSLFS